MRAAVRLCDDIFLFFELDSMLLCKYAEGVCVCVCVCVRATNFPFFWGREAAQGVQACRDKGVFVRARVCKLKEKETQKRERE